MIIFAFFFSNQQPANCQLWSCCYFYFRQC